MASADRPLISIVIPLYNQQLAFFRPALDSALGQTYPNVEVIVSDNHSTNDVPKFLATVGHPRLKVVKPPKFLPMVRHFGWAADQATGEYLGFLCSDDWLHPTCVEKLTDQLLANPQTVAAYSEIETVDYLNLDNVRLYTNRRRSGVRSAAESLNELLNARPFFAWIPGGLMQRSAYERVRHVLDGEITYAFDVALLFKLHEWGNVVYVDESLAKFRTWTAAEGKLGGARLLENIADIGRICQLLEDSPPLVRLLTNGLSDVKRWRAYQAKRWVMALLVGVVTGTITSQTCREGIALIGRELSPHPAGGSALSLLVGKPQVFLARPLLKALYKLYLSVQYRTKKAF